MSDDRPDLRRQTYGVHTRLSQPPSPELLRFFERTYLAGFDDDLFVAAYQVNLAHAVMLVETGIVPPDEGAQIIGVVRELGELGRARFPVDARLGDPLPHLEDYILDRLGDAVGGKLHTGRSRGDFYVTLSRLKFRARVFPLLRASLVFRATLLDLADEHLETLVPGYTHLQQAQPITLGHYFLAFVHQQERDFERLDAAYTRLNVSPMGLGIIGGSSYPLDRDRVADLLGFVGLIRNGRDLSDRDYAAELAADCSIVMMHLHRLATDLFIWSTSEFGFVRVDDSDALTSSIMPQKANPVLLETVLGATARVHGDLMAVLGTLKGGSANNTEATQADGPALRAIEETAWTLEVLGAVAGRMHVDRAVMGRLAAEHWAQATDLADALVRTTELSFRQAHRVVGAVVARALEEGRRPAETTAEHVRAAAERVLGQPLEVPSDAVQAALDPWQGVLTRRLPGGPAPDVVRPAIAAARDQLARDRAQVDDLEEALAAARARLEAAAEVILNRARGPR